jgi:hypothetical protein
MVSDREQARMASDRARELGVDLSKLSPDLEKLLDKISKISDWIKTP